MHQSLNKNLFLIREHFRLFSATQNYDVYDLTEGRKIIECREPELGFITKLLRFTDFSLFMPFRMDFLSPAGETVMSIKRGRTFLASRVKVLDGSGKQIGNFKQKFFSAGGKFEVKDLAKNKIFEVNGSLISREYNITRGDTGLASVTRKWEGLGKELFIDADNYVLTISDQVPKDDPVRPMLLAAVLCIDMVLRK